MIAVPYTLTFTDLEVTWLERVINNVVNDSSSNSNLHSEAEKLKRKFRDVDFPRSGRHLRLIIGLPPV